MGLTSNKAYVRLVFGFLASGLATSYVHAEDLTNLGGDLSSDLPGRHAIQVSAPNVTSSDRIAAQAAGFPVFHRVTKSTDGLGPRFINNSCGGCHIQNGRGPTSFGVPSLGGSSMVVKVKLRGLLADGSAPEVPRVGGQLLDQSVGKAIKRSLKVTWQTVTGKYKDGRTYTLRKPKVVIPKSLAVPRKTIISLRMSPALIGQGLLEAIPASTINGWSDPTDLDGDGISGRVNMVKDRGSDSSAIGRFGFKATQPTVVQQTAAALYGDMNITNPLFNDGDGKIEASIDDIHSISIYLRLAGVPKASKQTEASVIAGQELFKQLGCDSCHRMTVTTGDHSDPELFNQTIHPFTDLLLHDMGAGLADGWSEFSALGREWRTAPLWGLGFSDRLRKGKAEFLHDGRARSIEEAVLWHGGEAARSKNGFTALSVAQRKKLLEFLKSL